MRGGLGMGQPVAGGYGTSQSGEMPAAGGESGASVANESNFPALATRPRPERPGGVWVVDVHSFVRSFVLATITTMPVALFSVSQCRMAGNLLVVLLECCPSSAAL